MIARLLCLLLLVAPVEAGKPQFPSPGKFSADLEAAGFRRRPQVDNAVGDFGGTGRPAVDEAPPSASPTIGTCLYLGNSEEQWDAPGVRVDVLRFRLTCTTTSVDAILCVTATTQIGQTGLMKLAQLVSPRLAQVVKEQKANSYLAGWISVRTKPDWLELRPAQPWSAAEVTCFLEALPSLLEDGDPDHMVGFVYAAWRAGLQVHIENRLMQDIGQQRGIIAARRGFLLWKIWALWRLGRGPAPAAIAALRSGLADASARTRAETADLLGRMGTDGKGAAADLAKCATDPDPAARVFLAYAHYQVTGDRTVARPVLEAAAKGSDARARAAALEALRKLH
jgi:hypothetical protein